LRHAARVEHPPGAVARRATDPAALISQSSHGPRGCHGLRRIRPAMDAMVLIGVPTLPTRAALGQRQHQDKTTVT
jgi:hypothetical protein